MSDFKSILAIDVGSTTTKAILFGLKGDEFRLIDWAGASTTVEKPYENVIVGVKNAITKLEKAVKRQLLGDGDIITPEENGKGVDMFISTSSAGGGLQMLVGGVIGKMTAESAQKAALGAGAIVMDVFSIDDGRSDIEKIQRIQRLRPDMILLSGGIDGGNVQHVASLAELVSMAKPKSRLGQSYTLPVVFAGNQDARPEVDRFLKDKEEIAVSHVDNLRPMLEKEVLEPASNEIQNLFMEHVMSQAPGYPYLLEMTDGRVMPTPHAVGQLVKQLGETKDIDILAVDIGGATTDVFSSSERRERIIEFETIDEMYESVYSDKMSEFSRLKYEFRRRFTRSVDANLGMSYSIGNVLAEAGGKNILRWLPFDIEERELRDILSNKMIHPTVIPQTMKMLLIEQAVAREAIRLAIARHKGIAAGLHGVHTARDWADVLKEENRNTQSTVREIDVDVMIGSGGVLSHAPKRSQALLMMLDAFEPQGVTELYVDSIFMMPHLGIMSTISEDLAFELLKKDCLTPLGTCIAPVGPYKQGARMASMEVQYSDGRKEQYDIICGDLRKLPLVSGQEATVRIKPTYGYDCGSGPNRLVESVIVGGLAGIILDGRGRPLEFPADTKERTQRLLTWIDVLEAYPEQYLREVM